MPVPFSHLDSFNVHVGDAQATAQMTIDELSALYHQVAKMAAEKFKQTGINESVPTADQIAQLAANLGTAQYVLVGQNPGNKGVTLKFPENFHGSLVSRDYRLAAVTYGTPLQGALMTDANPTIESIGSKVTITQANVQELLAHLAELNVNPRACLVAMGNVVDQALTAYLPADRYHFKITHYGAQGHGWVPEKVHQMVLDGVAAYQRSLKA